ncbi:phosphatidylinositol N-acetylglucosaminyltransferase subunit Q-like [Saccostrea cucullata]|uniref:phosphatidylinositol N-acetylglucosaminyltransferase subunit Q-like n=1 Tax=Saccostrea cuccullata TaxID=36930 RepID=UPI002ED6697E
MIANLCWRQLLDCVLGITFTYFFINYNMTDYVAALIITWAYEVAENLHSLVEWLMGAPAGLKLNKQLTEFLGHFFLYHIYLWKGYLGILQTVLSSMLWYSSLLGLLGITAQLCFLRDVISMMSLHIYCFYVYAARLYRFQVYALSAFWRLFRGKKWNVLRQRLDSVRYDVDQLFLGTLLFTILLFTLPTCALYYVVFTMLRLVVLLAHELIDKVIQSLDLLPLYSVWMWCINSRYIKGDILFSIIPHSERDESSTFSLQIIQMPFRKLLKRSENPFRNAASQHYHWSKLIGDLVKGHLIYPWVEVSQS